MSGVGFAVGGWNLSSRFHFQYLRSRRMSGLPAGILQNVKFDPDIHTIGRVIKTIVIKCEGDRD
ncbi:uncharacterized protein BO88DRAFT_240785 [Aspergillus vadensis CBS 113365]|uniref:Uncharacterized protein n=1 Tax=Aspergillus vadensis (strain CBS 113365 / IMI 142717 / IBT 24658) TaxID=1448311 RepID=A0A319BIP1_ASPVC|nr:hypothetical protein BO88DRAFT_240785 [Aspergillus vadensis CBS 113365]PYH71789.1 hypothetical protein BO88DRAFT_240785 [Aspergillus vadensis CBS 113365]